MCSTHMRILTVRIYIYVEMLRAYCVFECVDAHAYVQGTAIEICAAKKKENLIELAKLEVRVRVYMS